MNKFTGRFKKSWMKFARAVGVVNGTIILSVIFVVFIGLYALIGAAIRRAAGLFRKEKVQRSTWQIFKNNQNSLPDLRRQF